MSLPTLQAIQTVATQVAQYGLAFLSGGGIKLIVDVLMDRRQKKKLERMSYDVLQKVDVLERGIQSWKLKYYVLLNSENACKKKKKRRKKRKQSNSNGQQQQQE